MLYDRPVADLMRDAAADLDPPHTPQDIIDWFGERYPKVKATTVTAHVMGLTANARSRRHYPTLAARPPLFFKTANRLLIPYDEDVHAEYIVSDLVAQAAIDEEEALVPDEAAEPASESAMEFALEAYLEEFILTNWSRIDWGRPLRIWEQDGRSGHQLPTPVGRPDFVAVDTATSALVVIELKRGRPTDRVVGQAARYMGWVRSELATPGQPVEGVIVAAESDLQLFYAAEAVPGLSVLLYEVSFGLNRAERPT